MNIKPGTLTTKHARKVINSDVPALGMTLNLIDRMSTSFSALEKLKNIQDPEITVTANAIRFKEAAQKAVDSIGSDYGVVGEQLAKLKNATLLGAKEKAGLLIRVPESELAEIRSALRVMNKTDRENAIRLSFENNDFKTAQAVLNSPAPFLIGEHSLPLDALETELINKNSPDLSRELEMIEDASTRLELAADSYIENVRKMRDIGNEELATQQKQQNKEAKKELADALGFTPTYFDSKSY